MRPHIGLTPDALCCHPLRGLKNRRIAARAEIAADLRQGMVIVRILDGIVLNRYTNDPGKRAAWIAASHVEKAPKKKEDPPTPPTPPTP